MNVIGLMTPQHEKPNPNPSSAYGRTTKCAGKIRRDARTAVDAHCPDTMQSLDDPTSQRIIHAPQERKVCSKLAA
ncbi:hypothetical protein G3A39_38300 [Paraburkholderia aspalathi]|uniref:hypothetical protein n=1 Tax=Paraburkholderia nemoris TaxID=2793076 RepID=UPI00190CC3EE|nr:hypothetical protein [Paraburkholderia nemoris]MBK3745049.1 hypothetical protein [Paraburkholderia aspalathi]